MELDGFLSWLALALTPGLASRLSARVLCKVVPPMAFSGPRARFAPHPLIKQGAKLVANAEDVI